MTEDGRRFLELSSEYLTREYLPKIRSAIAGLSQEELWWRPHEASNSIGNLLLHLTGNLRQWVLSGLGGETDRRARQEEFDARDGPTSEELLTRLSAAVESAGKVIREIDPETLQEERVIQGRRVPVMRAVYHAVEHFAGHTGQILLLTKQFTGQDLGFYRKDKKGEVRPSWQGATPEA